MKYFSLFKKLIPAFVISLILVSCGGGDSGGDKGGGSANGGAFQGTYAGVYNGSTTGDWTLTVDSSGNATGTANTTSGPVALKGAVNSSGASSLSGKAGATVTYTITIDTAGKVTGNWVDSLGGGGNITGVRVSIPTGNLKNASGTLKLIATDAGFGTKSLVVSKSQIQDQNGATTVSLINSTETDLILLQIIVTANGEVAAVTILNTNATKVKINKIYGYTVNCIANAADCVNINVNTTLKSATFSDLILTATQPNGVPNAATGTLTISGTANWN